MCMCHETAHRGLADNRHFNGQLFYAIIGTPSMVWRVQNSTQNQKCVVQFVLKSLYANIISKS